MHHFRSLTDMHEQGVLKVTPSFQCMMELRAFAFAREKFPTSERNPLPSMLRCLTP
jgi:hypothetical protein